MLRDLIVRVSQDSVVEAHRLSVSSFVTKVLIEIFASVRIVEVVMTVVHVDKLVDLFFVINPLRGVSAIVLSLKIHTILLV